MTDQPRDTEPLPSREVRDAHRMNIMTEGLREAARRAERIKDHNVRECQCEDCRFERSLP
jgi:hypothetical protein